jgi:hypothetical protein
MRAPARIPRTALVIGAAVLAALALSALATAKMRSTKISPRLCATTGGGRFVTIPGFPGERIDRRLLTDIRWLKRRYRIFITDGYSMDDVHAQNGEHPIGLALDIVPNKAKGGTWADVTALARWAEPTQGEPRSPFRWVGYDGDSGHGRGDHLHLSWNHTTTDPGIPARTIYTIRCPNPVVPPPPTEPPSGGTDGDGEVTPDPSGGIGGKLGPVTVETDGVGIDALR